jgi:eukaryotic-like serine/threonine-protein kinase
MSRVTIPDYELIRLLGQGSAGAVYLARHKGTGELVAIKHLHTDFDNVVAWRRFEREARIMQSLSHPSLVAVRELLELEGNSFLVLEYVAGATLADVLPLVAVAVGGAIVEMLACVLDVVHDASVVHRDVKPANVLLSVHGECKLTDFGVARFVGDSIHAAAADGIRTRTGTALGSPAYMSPEVASGQREIDRRADVYSLAVLAYALVVGRLPFAGDPYAILRAHINDPPPTPSEVEPAVPEGVDAVLLRGLSKEPARRYETAGAFAAALAAVLPGAEVPTAALAALVRSIAPTTSTEAALGDDRAAQSPTLDDRPANPTIGTLPRLPSAHVPIFRPRVRHRARFLVLAVAIGCAFGVLVALLHH